MKNRIKRIRNKYHLTQQKFGDALGTTSKSVQSWEYGYNCPSKAMQHRICSVFNVDLSWLETGEGDPEIVTDKAMIDRIVEQYNGSDVFRAVLETYITLPEDKRRVVEEFVSLLLDYKSKGISKDAYGVDDLLAQTEQAPTDSAQAE